MAFYASSATSAQTSSAVGRRRSMGLAVFAGLGAAVAGSIIWAAIAYLTRHEYSLVAILVGSMVGYTISRVRPGSAAAAVAGAALALLGCALGTFLALIFVAARAAGAVGTVLGHLNVIVHAYPHSVGGLGLVFWLMAVAIGFVYTLGLRHDRWRPEPAAPAAGPGPVAEGAPGLSSARPAPGGYGTPQAPSDHDGQEPPDDQLALGWPLEPVTMSASPAGPPEPVTVRQSGPQSLSPVPPMGPPPMGPVTARAQPAFGVAGPQPAFEPGGPLSGPLPAVPPVGPPPVGPPPVAPPPATPPAGRPQPAFGVTGPQPVFDAGPPSRPLPAVPPPGFGTGGPQSQPLPAVQPGPVTGRSPTGARHAAPGAPATGPAPNQSPLNGSASDQLRAPVSRRQRTRGRHSRP
jgi:hypothetical protein